MKLTYIEKKQLIKIEGPNNEINSLKRWFNRYEEGYMFDPRFKNKLWSGKSTKFNKKNNTIPMGLWKEAFLCCQENGYAFNFTNKSEFPLNRDIKKKDFETFIKEFFDDYKFQPREYQVESAYAILKNMYGNIAVATGGGKTFIYSLVLFYLLHKHPNEKFLLVVPSKTLVTQFYDDIIDYAHDKIDFNIREIFDITEKPRTRHEDKEDTLCIGTFQSLANDEKYPRDWFKQFFMVTVDEGHKSAAKSYRKILNRTINYATYRWGMSGTFPKDDTFEITEILARTGPILKRITAKYLMDLGYLTQVKIKGILLNHNDYEFREAIERVAARDKKACYDLEVAKIQESEHRLDVVSKIVKECKDNTLVLFHNTDYGEKLFEHLKEKHPDKDFHFISGKINNKKRTIIKEAMMETDRVQVLVASFGTLSTGVSISTITNVIFTQSFKKAQVIIQSIGRALRLYKGKKKAYIFDLVDIFNEDEYVVTRKSKFSNILYNHWLKRKKIYDEEEYPYDFIKINLPEPN